MAGSAQPFQGLAPAVAESVLALVPDQGMVPAKDPDQAKAVQDLARWEPVSARDWGLDQAPELVLAVALVSAMVTVSGSDSVPDSDPDSTDSFH